MTTSDLLRQAEDHFAKTLDHLKTELAGLQIGRASASLVENLQAEVYGAHQPIKNLANISVPDAKTLFIEPWDKGSLQALEKTIQDSRLGLNPSNDGQRIVLNIPPLTEERRRDLSKIVGTLAEQARISVRQARQDALKTADRLAKEDDSDITEDMAKGLTKQVQDKVDAANKEIDDVAKKKETDIMTI